MTGEFYNNNSNINLMDCNSNHYYDRANIDKEDIRAKVHARLPEFFEHLYPNAKHKKGNFYIGDVSGSIGKSMVMNSSGKYIGYSKDFGGDFQGDIFTLWAEVHHLDIKRDFAKVIRGIKSWLGEYDCYEQLSYSATNNYRKKSAPASNTDSRNSKQHSAENEAIKMQDNNSQQSKPSLLWDYVDEHNKPIYRIERYDNGNGGKEFKPFCYRSKKPKFPSKRIIYNLPQVIANQQIIFVEGEKCADALIAQGLTASCIPAGSNADISKTPWEPLSGKDIILWPDNDDVGAKFMSKIAIKLYYSGAHSIAWLEPPEDSFESWDAYDAIQEKHDVNKLISSAYQMSAC